MRPTASFRTTTKETPWLSDSNEQPEEDTAYTDVKNEALIRGLHNAEPSKMLAAKFLGKASIYFCFLFVLTYTVLNDRVTTSSYQFVRAVSRKLVTEDFEKISSMSSAFDYVKAVVCPAYVSGFVSWNGKRHNKTRPESNFLQQSVALSALRLRQHRIRSVNMSDWRDIFGARHPSARDQVDSFDTMPFSSSDGTKVWTYTNKQRGCTYNPLDGSSSIQFSLCSNNIEGNVPGTTYPAGGYIADINASSIDDALRNVTGPDNKIDKQQVVDVCEGLLEWIKEDMWLTEETRVLIVEFSVMNANLKEAMFGMPTMLFEFASEGGVEASFSVIPFQTKPAADFLEYILGVYAGLYLLIVIGRLIWAVVRPKPCVVCYMVLEAKVLKDKPWYPCPKCHQGFDRTTSIRCANCNRRMMLWTHTCFMQTFVMDFGQWMNVINMGLLLYSLLQRFIVRNAFFDRMEVLINWSKDAQAIRSSLPLFLDMGPLQQKMSLAFALNALNIVLTYFASYSYMRHFEVVAKFLRLFDRGSRMLLTFLVTFSIAFLGFAFAFHMSLGTRTNAFRTIEDAILNTFRLLLVDISFADFIGEAKWLMILLYVWYGIMCVIIALNVFISIVNAAYEQAIVPQPATQTFLSLVMLWRAAKGLIWDHEEDHEEDADDELEATENHGRRESRRSGSLSGGNAHPLYNPHPHL